MIFADKQTANETEPWLIVGLGNPGPEYARTRHNIGQMVLDHLASQMGANYKKHKSRAAVAQGRLRPGGDRLLLAKPLTYMNLSGGPVAALSHFYGIGPDRVLVLHDDLDIPFDTIKLKCGGGEGGHNGLRDISKALGSKDYYRVRLGIGRPPGTMQVSDYVLRPFSSSEAKILPFHIDRAASATELLLEQGLLAAQQRFHTA